MDIICHFVMVFVICHIAMRSNIHHVAMKIIIHHIATSFVVHHMEKNVKAIQVIFGKIVMKFIFILFSCHLLR